MLGVPTSYRPKHRSVAVPSLQVLSILAFNAINTCQMPLPPFPRNVRSAARPSPCLLPQGRTCRKLQ